MPMYGDPRAEARRRALQMYASGQRRGALRAAGAAGANAAESPLAPSGMARPIPPAPTGPQSRGGAWMGPQASGAPAAQTQTRAPTRSPGAMMGGIAGGSMGPGTEEEDDEEQRYQASAARVGGF